MNASSGELKDDITTLSTEDANAALEALSPVRYVYKSSRDEEYLGFIAEDVFDPAEAFRDRSEEMQLSATQ